MRRSHALISSILRWMWWPTLCSKWRTRWLPWLPELKSYLYFRDSRNSFDSSTCCLYQSPGNTITTYYSKRAAVLPWLCIISYFLVQLQARAYNHPVKAVFHPNFQRIKWEILHVSKLCIWIRKQVDWSWFEKYWFWENEQEDLVGILRTIVKRSRWCPSFRR